MTKRGQNEGSIHKRTDGRWCGVVNLGWEDGKRKRKYLYGDTRREVAEKLNAVLRDQQQGLPATDGRQTVDQFLTRWLEESAKPRLRPRTFESYRMIVTRHLIPGLGRIPLSKLGPQDVQHYMNRKRGAGLSARTVQYHRAVLRRALNQALRWGLIPRNVATLVDPPKSTRPALRFLSTDEARVFLGSVRGHRLEALYTVALALGLRQGEALGLAWEDVDLEAGLLTIRYALQRVDGKLTRVAPKTEKSRRVIAMPAVALAALRQHRTRQLEERLVAGSRWQEAGFVFTTSIGTPLDARNLTRHFHQLREAAGLPWLRFHDLRHAYGSLLAAQGVHPRVAMELMGHSQLAVTMQVYTHVAPELAREAADKIDAVLGGAK
ncbi:tyrosine-type recombinase/integrase [Nitrolancea hollandica]|uniref:Integrase family protein n=1 Tax=Nitrolancea hollandica Lb TaxID=1129897 RepID=I4EM97_9BACT|nr:tyrosine-type recombinase/integrase [Nitrolancea hollandica]CCF85810.1 Integrase family protein [Nitrolancea hollandica Lb]